VLESVLACRNNSSSKHFMAEESSPAMKKLTQTNKQINKTKLVRASPLTHNNNNNIQSEPKWGNLRRKPFFYTNLVDKGAHALSHLKVYLYMLKNAKLLGQK
jgi:hypothetical protein